MGIEHMTLGYESKKLRHHVSLFEIKIPLHWFSFRIHDLVIVGTSVVADSASYGESIWNSLKLPVLTALTNVYFCSRMVVMMVMMMVMKW